MTGPSAAVAAVRVAVRRALQRHDLVGTHVVVACSGGADSLALAAGAAFVVPRAGGSAGGVVIDHGLQSQSAAVSRDAAEGCHALGLDPVQVVAVRVVADAGGPEQAARTARLDALAEHAVQQGAKAVLLGHTQQDQAEQVLLGLARGSGTRSLSGMPSARVHGPAAVLFVRPLLELPREVTSRCCADLGLRPWSDPHNEDPAYTRVRARRVLPLLEQELGPGVVAALARSADLLREDADTLDELSWTTYQGLGPAPWPTQQLVEHPRAVRMRLWRRLAVDHGAPAGSLSAAHLGALDALLSDWHGQGPVDLPGGLHGRRRQGQVWVERATPS